MRIGHSCAGATAWPDDKGFLGKTADTRTGLTHIGAREYDPGIGQFLSVDPVLQTELPQTLNGYSYAAQNPATHSDPTGLALACGSQGPEGIPCPDDGDPMPEPATHDGNGHTLGEPGQAQKDAEGRYCNSACLGKIYYQEARSARSIARKAAADRLLAGFGVLPTYDHAFEIEAAAMLAWDFPEECDEVCREIFWRLDAKNHPQPGASASESKHLGDVIGGLLKGGLRFRNKVSSFAIGKGYNLLAEAVGADCDDSGGLTVCRTSVPIYARGGTTVGHTYVTGYNPAWAKPARLKHERVHAEQWDSAGEFFAPLYFLEGFDPCHNIYEEAADWKDGGYLQCVR